MKKNTFLKLIVGITVLSLVACSNNNDEDEELELIPVTISDKCGYIDKTGKYVINPQFAFADKFCDGLARVKTADNKIGYINKEGQYVIPAIYEAGSSFSEGLAFVVSENSTPICIDTKGNEVFRTPSNVLFVDQFSKDGIAKVKVEGDKFGFIDKTGQFIVTPQYNAVLGPSSEGLAAVKSSDSKWGFVDVKGNIVINPQFDDASNFSNGLACISQGDKWGYINKKGEYVINPQFDYACSFSSDGLASIKQGKQWGFIDTDGQIVINPQFDEPTNFNNGLAVVRQGDLFGVVNKKGEYVINPQFDDIHFTFAKNEYIRMSQHKRFGYINTEGKIVINPQFDDGSKFYGGIAFVQLNQKWGIIDEQGKYIVMPQYDVINNITSYKEGLLGEKIRIAGGSMDNRIYTTKFYETPILDYIYDRNSWLNDSYNNTIGKTAEMGEYKKNTYEDGLAVQSPIKNESINLSFLYVFDKDLYYGESFDAQLLYYALEFRLYESESSITDEKREDSFFNSLLSSIENNDNVKFEKVNDGSWIADNKTISYIIIKTDGHPYHIILMVTKNKDLVKDLRKRANAAKI
ncbi:MAG: WG repeat-containing protein [Bacteroidales bacterium]|nr:WG repeat-containing protein [Bacteroidales bacterium]